ncbi:MAG: bifunctional nuclease family protein [Anaerolineae bacterium]|nr:bifunctional nuclease family protein [Anaerolineae bacterium]
MIKVFIDSIRVSLMSQLRVVILKDPVTNRYLPIFIGPCEAEAIAMKLQNVTLERPMTHDLLKAVITDMGGTVQHIVVNDLRNDTFYAQIVVEQNGQTLAIDARPSDAIALSVRLEVPIFVAEAVMERAAVTEDDDVEADTPVPDAAPEVPDNTRLSVFKDFVDTLDLDDLSTDDDDDND